MRKKINTDAIILPEIRDGTNPDLMNLSLHMFYYSKARFKRRILHAPNAIQTMHNEEAYLIIYCLNCIWCMQNSTFETGLTTLKKAAVPSGRKFRF